MSTRVSQDVCDLSLIYGNQGYDFFFPRDLLESYFSGKAFDNKEKYTIEESENLREDINEIYQNVIQLGSLHKKHAVISCGSPLAGKTTLLNQMLNSVEGRGYALVDPDEYLKQQKRTYCVEIEKGDRSEEARKFAYNKWRPGSNAAAHVILANLIRDNRAIYFGSTSSSPQTFRFFEFLKKRGYEITLIHVSASDTVRFESAKIRDQNFIQTTEEDIKQKGMLAPQRIQDTYLKYADKIKFYHRSQPNGDAKLAAEWIRDENASEPKGTLEVFDEKEYSGVKNVQNTAASFLNRSDLTWENTVEKSSRLIKV